MKIEYDTDTETVTIDGVRISMHALRQFTQHPNPLALYRIQREGHALTIKELSTSYGVLSEWASIETAIAAREESNLDGLIGMRVHVTNGIPPNTLAIVSGVRSHA